MALQASGQISLGNLATEFGGSAPHALSEYYRGGGLVPDVAQNSNVPTSGQVSLAHFYSAAAYVNVGASVNTATPNGEYSCVYDPPYTECPLSTNVSTSSGSGPAVVTASGGNGSYTYSWAYVSGDVLNMSGSTSASTNFSHTSVGQNESKVGVYRCTVSDGISSATVDVTVTLTYSYT